MIGANAKPLNPSGSDGWLSRISIRTRIYAGFGALSLLGIGLATIAVIQLQSIESDVGRATKLSANTARTLQVSRLIESMRRDALINATQWDAGTVKSYADTSAEALGLMTDAAKTATSATRRQTYGEVGRLIDELRRDFTRQATLADEATRQRETFLAVGGDLVSATGRLLRAATDLDNPAILEYAQRIESSVLTTQIAGWRFLSTRDPKGPAAFKSRIEESAAAIKALEAKYPPASVGSQIGPLDAALRKYDQSFGEVANRILAIDELYQTQIRPREAQAFSLLDAARQSLQADTASATTRATSTVETSTDLQEAITALSFVASLLLAWLIGRGIANPIQAMSATMKRLAGGDKTTEIPSRNRGDEIGIMARSVDEFRLGLIRADELEAEARRLSAEAEATARKVAQEQAAVIGDVRSALDAMADGDLTHRIERPFGGDYEALRQIINTTFERLNAVIVEVGEAARTIDASTAEVAEAADDLARRTQQQAANLEETAAATEELSSTVKKTADTAREAEARTMTAKSIAEQGGEIAKDTVAAMQKIEKSSKEMVAIVDVIEEIAFQTNLLALNAGVEAARAGEAGMGFAVVATEVRALAQRCGEAVKQIKTLIVTSEDVVADGVQLVNASGKSLTEIVSAVSSVTEMVQHIAGACREQSAGISETTVALGSIDQGTQQNTAMVEETTAAAQSLATQANTLVDLVGRFRTTGGAVAARQSKSRPTGRPAPTRRAAPARPAAPAASASATTPAPAAAVGDDWRSF